jgi:hypothetical protein
MSYLSDGGVYTLTDEGADRLIKLEESHQTFPLPAGFTSQLERDPKKALNKLQKMGFVLPNKK